ncbi:MAG: acyltransferase family protein [Planctomycetota bacterium]
MSSSTVESPDQGIPARRHDLDALRAVAMLLGILLHAAISFLPAAGQWPVQDSETSPAIMVLISAIHGFRMPLFFLISGYFTCMLYRRRGLAALLVHRFKRIFVPFVLSMVTIIPLSWVLVGTLANSKAGSPQQADSMPSIWREAANGDLAEVNAWLESGGDPNQAESDGSTAVHAACLFGRSEMYDVLVAAGGDPWQTNSRGDDGKDMLMAPWGITAYVAGLVQVDADRERVMAGRQRIAEKLGAVIPSNITDGEASPPAAALAALMVGLNLMHLWFLWFLCLLVLGFSTLVGVGRLILRWITIPRISPWWITSPARYAWLVPATAACQWSMAGDAPTFGAATSTSLLPTTSVLIYYAIFFGFGALWYDSAPGMEENSHDPESMPDASTLSAPQTIRGWLSLLLASLLVVFPMGMRLMEADGGITLALSAVLQATYAWWMSFAAMGFFARYFSARRGWMRYLSDGSYWMYLIHLPLVWLLQFWVRDWEAPLAAKLLTVCVVTSMAMVVSYHVFVRYTFIGTLLNGRRRRLFGKSERPAPSIPTHAAV